MATPKTRKKALQALNYDLFEPQDIAPPAPATIGSKINAHLEKEAEAQAEYQAQAIAVYDISKDKPQPGKLPSIDELYRLFDRFNWLYFDGKLPQAKIEYSNRMTSAGSYSPDRKLIKISRKYHDIFPEDIEDTLKHEMIHIIHYRHDKAFKREAKRIGCSLKAKSHPELRQKTKYLYICPSCKREYPRRKRLQLASCGYCSPKGKYDVRFKLVYVKQDD